MPRRPFTAMSYVLGGTFMRLVQLHARHGASGAGNSRVLFSSFSPPHSRSPVRFPVRIRESPRTPRDIKPTSMAILRRFFAMSGAPLGCAYCTQGFTARFRTLFASRCLCGRGAIWADISAECPRQVHVKGDYGNLSLLLHVLFARELRDTMT